MTQFAILLGAFHLTSFATMAVSSLIVWKLHSSQISRHAVDVFRPYGIYSIPTYNTDTAYPAWRQQFKGSNHESLSIFGPSFVHL